MGALKIQDIRHLMMRTGLGVRWHDLKRYQEHSKTTSVRHIIDSANGQWALPAPTLMGWYTWNRKYTPQQHKQLHHRLNNDKQALKQWQVQMLLRTPTPLTERMVLFWHNHFTTSIDKVNQPALLLKQNMLFRQQGLGNFKQLLHAVARDPAMLIYLDNNSNKAGRHNENFARELLELFTLGEGHFTEADVRGAAQAFTGWSVDHRTGTFVINQAQHDSRLKSFMGKKGNFKGDDILDIVLKNPYTAETIAQKFWAEFVSDETPNPVTIRHWGNTLRRADYDIRTLLTTVLNSHEFWSTQNRAAKIKSPVELIIGSLRSLTLTPPSHRRIVNLCSALGQPLFSPESPKGYSVGQDWIDTYTLPTRVNVMSSLIRKANQRDMARIPVLSKEQKIAWLLANRMVDPLSQHALDSDNTTRTLHVLLTDPSYQLT
jgi:uncharacterized protein (DUF1800 family)